MPKKLDVETQLDRLINVDEPALWKDMTPLYLMPADITVEQIDKVREAIVELHVTVESIKIAREIRDKTFVKNLFNRK
jgi:hypothetical protein